VKKIEYRCNRCLLIYEQWIPNNSKPFDCKPCYKCNGLALKLPWSESKKNVFKNFKKPS